METSIGNYNISSTTSLGKGAYASVYLGHHKQDPTVKVAVKRIGKDKYSISERPPAFVNEIAVLQDLKSIKHENIVCLFDFVDTDKELYLILEYCNGNDLGAYLICEKEMAEDSVRIFLQQMVSAMRVLHSKQILHRDMKPANILLNFQGKSYPAVSEITFKLADFGLSRYLSEGSMAETLCGSPVYMAPEVVAIATIPISRRSGKNCRYGGKADLWSIGVITYECFHGEVPFKASKIEEIIWHYRNARRIRMRKGTSLHLQNLLLGLLSIEPGKRMDFEAFFNHPFLLNKEDESKEIKYEIPLMPPKEKMLKKVLSASPILQGGAASVKPTFEFSPPVNIPMRKKSSNKENMSNHRECLPQPRCSSPLLDDFVVICDEELTISGDKEDLHNSDEEMTSLPSTPVSKNPGFRTQSAVMNLAQRSNLVGEKKLQPMDIRPGAVQARQRPLMRFKAECQNRVQSSPDFSFLNFPFQFFRKLTQPHIVNNLPEDRTSPLEDEEMLSLPSTPVSKNPVIRRQSVMNLAQGPALTSNRKSSPPMAIRPNALQAGPLMQLKAEYHRTQSSPNVGVLHSPSDKEIMQSRRPSLLSIPSMELITPPEVQFKIGSYPTTSICSRCNSSCSPALTPYGSPIRFTDKGSVIECKTSPSYQRSPSSPGFFLGSSPSFGSFTNSSKLQHVSSSNVMQTDSRAESPDCTCADLGNAMSFYAPELSDKTLMDDESLETVKKLEYILELGNAIVDLAKSRSSPLSHFVLVNANRSWPESGSQRCIEQLLLYVRALQLFGTAIENAKNALETQKLLLCDTTKTLLKGLNDNYQECLQLTRQLKKVSDLTEMKINFQTQSCLTINNLLFGFAQNAFQNAIQEERFGSTDECFKQYNTSRVLLHWLELEAVDEKGRNLLKTYRDDVERRLMNLHSQGIVYLKED